MTTTTEARRALLAVLLDRAERGALLDSERPLLRPLVLAEQADAEQAEAVIARVRALHTRTTVQTTAGPTEVCSHCEADGMSYPWPCETTDALDGPSPTPDDAQTTPCPHLQPDGCCSGPGYCAHACDDDTPTTADDRQARVTAALTAEHYRRAHEQIVASPEEHSAAMAAVAVAALADAPSEPQQ